MEASTLARPVRVALRPSRRLLTPLSDERLVEQLRSGNDAAFEVIYDRHHRGILGFCRHMLRSPEEAEDAVQQTFISAYGDLAASDKPIRLKPWLYTIARNRCLSILRARREQPTELPEIATAGLSDAVLERDDLRRLLADVQQLPEDQRAALVLSELGDLSHAEIGEIVGCDAVKVKALVFQARSSLIESRRAAEIPCQEIREQLATATGGALRRGALRRHVRSCPGCAEFRDSVSRQRTMLALALPVLPTVGLKHGVLAAVGLAPGAAGGAAGGAVAGGAAGVGGGSSGGAATVASGLGTSGIGASGLGASGLGGAATTGGGILSSIGAAGAAKIAVVAVVVAGGGVAVQRATSVDHGASGGATSAHDGARGSGAAAGGAAAGGALAGPAAARAAAARAHAAQHSAAAGKGAHGKGAHGAAAHGHHGHGPSGAHGNGAASSGSPGRSNGSSVATTSSSNDTTSAPHGHGPPAQTGIGASHSPGGPPSQTGVGAQLGSSHGPPAGHPPHPVNPGGGNGSGHGQGRGPHPAG